MITLVIIGVIAAITVPTLINKIQNQEYVSKLKKAYSTLSQATNLIIAEEGTPRGDKGGWANDVDSIDKIFNLYKKHLVSSKECGVNSGCMKQSKYKFFNSSDLWVSLDTYPTLRKLVLNDGTQVAFVFQSNSCDASFSGAEKGCASIFVDVNGEKKPNIIGRDFFEFSIKEYGLYPAGCGRDDCPNSVGFSCACKVLREGAMNY